MFDVTPHLEASLSEEGRAWFARAREELAARGPDHLPILFPQLARRLGRTRLDAPRVEEGEVVVDLGAWRTCDAGGCVLILDAAPSDDVLLDLYLHGDLEERTIALRSLAFLPVTPATERLLGEMQRTNAVVHVEAGAMDSNLAVRALDAGGEAAGFTRDDFDRLVLKIAFLDVPIRRVFGAMERATSGLSAMLIDYATEREAAGRSVWVDTGRFLGRAPAP
ncbi:MAG: EboA domain-containing protein, partial [Planctomycetota bacterium]